MSLLQLFAPNERMNQIVRAYDSVIEGFISEARREFEERRRAKGAREGQEDREPAAPPWAEVVESALRESGLSFTRPDYAGRFGARFSQELFNEYLHYCISGSRDADKYRELFRAHPAYEKIYERWKAMKGYGADEDQAEALLGEVLSVWEKEGRVKIPGTRRKKRVPRY